MGKRKNVTKGPKTALNARSNSGWPRVLAKDAGQNLGLDTAAGEAEVRATFGNGNWGRSRERFVPDCWRH